MGSYQQPGVSVQPLVAKLNLKRVPGFDSHQSLAPVFSLLSAIRNSELGSHFRVAVQLNCGYRNCHDDFGR